MKIKTNYLVLLLLLIVAQVNAQDHKFTHQDTLRGSVTKERAWWDLKYYHLDVAVNPSDSTLKGRNTIRFQVTDPFQVMQIDLQEPMLITKVYQDKKLVRFTRDGNAWLVQLTKVQKQGAFNEIIVQFEGRPRISRNPPWSGGLSWRRDNNNSPFIVTTCQGGGASIWWPCKDHQYDEPDSMLISVTVPENLIDVSNGRLRGVVQNAGHTKTFNWFVSNPINNYGVNLNIADYVHFSEKYQGEKGVLDCDYYVLKYNLEKAKTYFQEVKRMLDALEHWFGPYPFYEDSYKLVEVPYPGMEHQSSVTYGNGYKYGYGGRDESRTGWGMKFDFIIVHESAHEWFGNSITSKDIADMWIHESFGAYSESLFVDYHFGKQAGNEYCIGTRANIRNRSPIIGYYNVNAEGSGDMYSKGANMLHTLRQLVDNDEKFRGILRGLSAKFYHQTVTTEQIENYLREATGMDLKLFFDQYLRNTKIPVFEYSVDGKILKYRWKDCIAGFNMPLKIRVNEVEKWVNPSTDWKELEVDENSNILPDPNFYVFSALKTQSEVLYNDVNQTIEARVNDLVSRMTIEEKISQMQHTAPSVDRLGIPAYNWWNEALHGVARNGVATVFPQAIGMAATWNTALINQEADIISTEARAKYYEAIGKNEHGIYQGLTFWSPNINIFRDPRWGRGPESDRHRFDAWPTETDLYETYLPAFEALVCDAKVYSFMGAYNRVYGTPACANDLLLEKNLREKWGFKGYVVSDCWAISDFYKFHKFVPDAAKASALAVKAGETIKLSVTVTNSGSYDGDEVVQVYCRQPESVTNRPLQSLSGFQRIHLKKGESKVISFEVSPIQLRHFDTKIGDYSIAKGNYELQVGAASNDIRGTANIEIK